MVYWIWLAIAGGVGNITALRLVAHFGSAEAVYSADIHQYNDVAGINRADISSLANKNLEPAEKVLARCKQLGYRVIALDDPDYPERLRNIYDPPVVLYIRGNLPKIDDEAAVGVVGTRRCTPYGKRTAEQLGYCLTKRGLLVVTGLAKGIDSAAARGALKAGGNVVGVIGTGPDIVFPAENWELFYDVASHGAIVSEYPPGMKAHSGSFPARNRIISGLSLGVAVLESPAKSGALITAVRALEQGRDVFAMPGNVDARSCAGSNNLLREGAIPILSGDHIADEYIDLFPGKITIALDEKEIDKTSQVEYIDLDKILRSLSGDEKIVASTIGTERLNVDEIIRKSALEAAQVQTALTMLEIREYASQSAGVWQLGAGI